MPNTTLSLLAYLVASWVHRLTNWSLAGPPWPMIWLFHRASERPRRVSFPFPYDSRAYGASFYTYSCGSVATPTVSAGPRHELVRDRAKGQLTSMMQYAPASRQAFTKSLYFARLPKSRVPPSLPLTRYCQPTGRRNMFMPSSFKKWLICPALKERVSGGLCAFEGMCSRTHQDRHIWSGAAPPGIYCTCPSFPQSQHP